MRVCGKAFRLLIVASASTLFLVSVAGNFALSATNESEFSFAIVPQQSASKTARTWVPVLRYLSEKSGYKLRFETSKNIPTFEDALAREKFDFSYMNPYHYIVNHEQGYSAIAKAEQNQIRGILIVARDSELHTLADLRGLQLAFPSPNAFAASMIPRANLNRLQIDVTPIYVNSHDSVYRGVAEGLFPAGGGVLRTFEAAAPEVRSRLKILWTSEGYTPHAFVAHQRISAEVIKAVSEAMISMKNDAQGRTLLQTLKIIGIETARDTDWNDIRRLPF